MRANAMETEAEAALLQLFISDHTERYLRPALAKSGPAIRAALSVDEEVRALAWVRRPCLVMAVITTHRLLVVDGQSVMRTENLHDLGRVEVRQVDGATIVALRPKALSSSASTDEPVLLTFCTPQLARRVLGLLCSTAVDADESVAPSSRGPRPQGSEVDPEHRLTLARRQGPPDPSQR